jgi:hypothetical protein
MPAAHSPAANKPGTLDIRRIRIDRDAAHDVVRRRADLHRLSGDVDVRELLELVACWQLLLDVLRRRSNPLPDP